MLMPVQCGRVSRHHRPSGSPILATAGREIVTNEPGTLGGFFKDNNNSNVFGITCGHVGQIRGTSVSLEDSAGVTHQNAGSVTELIQVTRATRLWTILQSER